MGIPDDAEPVLQQEDTSGLRGGNQTAPDKKIAERRFRRQENVFRLKKSVRF